MALRLGDLSLDLTAPTASGESRFHDWPGGNRGVIFSHPADFAPVAPLTDE
ncbi:hypothetical protein [Streptomyces bobili]